MFGKKREQKQSMCDIQCPDCKDPHYDKPGGRTARRSCSRCKGTGTVRVMKRTWC